MTFMMYRYGAWAGPVFIAVVLLALVLLGFLPPVPPAFGPVEVAAHYLDHRMGMLIGGTLLLQFAVVMFVWVASISAQMRRIRAEHAAFAADLQMLFGLVGNLLFLLAAMAWLVGAFRADRSPELVLLMNDVGWLILLTPVFQFALQGLVIGSAILSDQRSIPLFPRWSAYLNFWVGLLLLPGAAAPFFKTGPFAWSGLFVFLGAVICFRRLGGGDGVARRPSDSASG